MQVVLVCKREYGYLTKGKEYPFYFDPDHAAEGCDGYIIEDDGGQHWLTLPSNNHRFPDLSWRSADYFTEVVQDPEH